MSQTKAQLLNPLGDLDLTGQLTGVGATFTGNITAVDGIFSGNVSVAGTLTKQDVTNVDSVGLITARSGIRFSTTASFLGADTSDASDNKYLAIAGGGAVSQSRGASVVLYGNEESNFPGQLNILAGNVGSAPIKFYTGGSQSLEITSGGGVKYQDADTPSSTNNPAQILNHSGGWQFYGSSDSGTHRNIIFGTNNAAAGERLRISSSGFVGIGTNNPTKKLHVEDGNAEIALFQSTRADGSYVNLNVGANGAALGMLGSGAAILSGGADASDFGIRAAGDLCFASGGHLEKARFDTGGRLLIGQTSGASLYANGLLQVSATDGNAAISVTRWSNNGSSPYINLGKSRGAVGTYTTVAQDDRLGQINFTGADGTDLASPAAGIAAYVDGTPGSNDMPGRLVFFTASDGGVAETERLRIGSSGQIGIAGANYGNAGQVLTSGGSGAAISWADAAGGATYSGISSGAMSAGDPVVVRDDGKLEKVKYSWNESINTGSVAEKNSINIPSAGVWANWARNDDGTTWNNNEKRVLFLFRNSNSPSYITADYDGNALTLNSMSGWNDGDNVAIFDGAYNSNAKRFAVAYRHGGNGRIRVNSGRPSGTTVTWGTTSNNGRPEINSSSSSNAVGIEYAGNDKFMVVYGEGNKIFAQVVTNSSNNNYMELSAGTRTEIEDVGAAASYKLTVSPPDSNGRMLMFYRKALGGDFGLKMAVLTISGTNVSYGGRAWVSSTNTVMLQTPLSAISYDPNEDRYLLTYERVSDSRLYGRNMKIDSATTISMSAETQLSTQNPYEGQGTVYDTNLKKHFVYFTDGSTNKLSYVPVTFTGSSAPTAGTLGVIYNTAHRMRSFTIDYDATLGRVLTGARNEDSGPNFLAGLINQTASSTTNLGENNFLGFSKGSYTDGNTAKIGTLSAVDENQTGLTTTTHYYVQPDGTLSTTAATPRVTAGKAVSSTNLIVKSDNDPRPGSLGHWTYSLSAAGSVFKPWCACGYGSNQGGIIGAYECANSSCRYCTGCWQPYCCVQGQEYWNYDLPTESGGNMCLGCGGCDCDSGYNITRACCCCWPTGRFWFPEVGIYCYNLNMILSSCMGAPPSGGCWSALAYYAVPKCRNRNCCNVFCGINGYHAYTTAACGYCEPRQAFDNVHIDGIVGVADTTKNFMAFGISKASMTNCVIVQNGVTLRGDGCIGRYPNYVSFQKISNCPQITYCN